MNAPACIGVNESDTCLKAERFTLRHLPQDVTPMFPAGCVCVANSSILRDGT
jgi:hypothetical protein